MIKLDFCDRFSYPPQIREQFSRILSVMDSSQVKSVLLYGSTSTGEIGYTMSDSGIELYSDYEFIVIARKAVDKNYKKRLSEHFLNLEKEFFANPLFRIDFSFVSAKKLHKGFRHITAINWRDAIPVFGEDVRHLIPELNNEKVIRHFHNEMLIWGLWTNILYFPIEVLVNKKVPERKDSWWKYVLCKNCLRIPMWLLPLEGIFLASYRRKIDYISHSYHELKASHFFDEGFIDFLNECHIGKTKIEFRRDAVGLFERVTKYYLSARRYLLDMNGFHEDELFSNARGEFFIDNSAKRIMYDLYLLFLKSNPISTRGFRWFFSSKYGLALDFLYDMNLALSYHLVMRSEESIEHLRKAHECLEALVLEDPVCVHIDSADFPSSWILLRDGFSRFLSSYIPSLMRFNDKVLGTNSL